MLRKKAVLFIASIVALALLGCGIPQEKYDADIAALKSEIEKVRAQSSELERELGLLRAQKMKLEDEVGRLQEALTELTGERDALAKAEALAKKRIDTFRAILAKFKAMIESGKIKIKISNNKMIVEMASAILFPSGSAKLSDEGEQALSEVASILSTIQDRSFQVAGHTDNIPIKNKKFKSNWTLSSARAVAVVQHLIESGMNPINLSAAGYADTQPVASNDEEEGRAQNRRIEIVLQPNLDELPNLSSLEKMMD